MIDAETMKAVADRLGLENFDLLLIGDGSGTVWNKPCGWCCHAWVAGSPKVTEHRGGTSGGTNNFAELMPYVHALWSFHTQAFAGTNGWVPGLARIRVKIVSDSEVTVRCGNRIYARRANGCLWAAIEWFEANGYDFYWTHVPRNSNPANERADKVAGEVRKLFELS